MKNQAIGEIRDVFRRYFEFDEKGGRSPQYDPAYSAQNALDDIRTIIDAVRSDDEEARPEADFSGSWTYAYVDKGESADGFPVVAGFLGDRKGAIKAMWADARNFVRGLSVRDCSFESVSPTRLIISLNGVVLCQYAACNSANVEKKNDCFAREAG